MDTAIAELNQKLDRLTDQVAFLTEQARLQARAREDRAELLRDLTPIANDAFRLTTEQLEEIQDDVDLGDLLYFGKRLLRNGRNFDRLLDQLESAMDLADTVGPLGDAAFARAVDSLDALDRKGYFAFARGGLKILDNIVTSYSEEDVAKLGDNIVLILDTVKEMTQPEIMGLVKSTVEDVDKSADVPVDISYRSLLHQMRDPNVRRGLAMSMRVLGSLGQQTPEGDSEVEPPDAPSNPSAQ
jgi:uncharacterized protein YjgD (DUF1641 family)